MREILFRGRSEESDEWIYGSFVPDALELNWGREVPWGFIRRYNPDGMKTEMHEVERETVGQYTGLKDQNGKQIFEGDLVLCDRHIAPSVDKQVFQITYDPVDGFTADSWSSSITMESYDLMEIVGNIHDNPEMLREG